MIIFYIYDILRFLLPLIPWVVLVCLVMAWFWRKRGYDHIALHQIAVGVFILYLAALFYETISVTSLILAIKEGRFQVGANINLIPFRGIMQIFQSAEPTYILVNILGNILVFLPAGFLLPLIFQKLNSAKNSILTGLVISAFIETAQLFSFRGTDVDDLILNTLGAFLGYLLLKLINKLYPQFVQKFKPIAQKEMLRAS